VKPTLLRAVAFGVLILGLLFKIQHWPGAHLFLLAAWGLALILLIVRLVSRAPIVPKEVARDVFTLALLSVIVMRMLHLPGRGFALGGMVLAALGLFWYERDRILPGKGDRGAMPWLFYPALVLIITGTAFRIQHWPYSTTLILGGLALAAIWFFSSMRADREQ